MAIEIDILDEAEKVLLEGGFQKKEAGPVRDKTKPHCMLGAISCALYMRGLKAADISDITNHDIVGLIPVCAGTVISAIARNIPNVWYDLPEAIIIFNDKPGTTLNDVLDVLHKAQIELKERGVGAS